MNEYRISKTGPFCVILSAMLFGMMPLFTKITYAFGCNTYTAALGRFGFGAIGIIIVITVVPQLTFHITRREGWHIFLLSLPFCATTLLLYGSYNSISSGLATTLHFTYPVIVMVLSTVFFHTKLQSKQVLCLLICIAGILCLYRPGGDQGTTGIIMALLSGLTYSLYIILLRRSELGHLHVLTITFWLSVFSLLEMGTFSAASGNLVIPVHWQAWAAMAGLGISASVIALALFQIGVHLCGEIKASLLSTFEPLTGVVIGILVFHENLTVAIVAGILLILLSAILLVVNPKPPKAGRC